ncbi:MAG TPA: DUF2785 domain-containing protein [Anaerolineales bacterium]|nr:DUF2785 domain-containing protein [Anaerolineales bacterium]
MDKNFWHTIKENKYAFPQGHDLTTLTDELFSYIPSTDPDLRDGIGYEIFANWIETEPYQAEQLRGYLKRLLENLQVGLGQQDDDSVFGRAFSVLYLAEVIHRDNQQPYLESHEVKETLTRVLAYLAAERDPRGYVPVKGWAHALAHTADMLMVFARSPHLGATELEHILSAVSEKMRAAKNWIYIHGEDDRLARAIVTALAREELSLEQVKAWFENLTTDWKGAWDHEEQSRAYLNARNLLRAIHLRILQMKELPRQEELSALALEAAASMRPF